MTEEQYNFECDCEGQALAELEIEEKDHHNEVLRYEFRAWDKQYHIMGIVVELGLRKGSKIAMLYDGSQTYGNIENYEIMQYTGLKDKNGIKIYEGDILKYRPNGYTNNIKVKVEYCNESGVIGYIFKYKYGWDYISSYSEVIGNIYQNSELMSEK